MKIKYIFTASLYKIYVIREKMPDAEMFVKCCVCMIATFLVFVAIFSFVMPIYMTIMGIISLSVGDTG